MEKPGVPKLAIIWALTAILAACYKIYMSVVVLIRHEAEKWDNRCREYYGSRRWDELNE